MFEKILYMFLGAVLFGVGTFGFLYLNDDEESGITPSVEQEQRDAEQLGKSVLFTNLYRGSGKFNKYSKDVNDQLVLVAENKEEFDTVWQDLFQGTLALSKPLINFDEQIVLVAMTGQKASGEHLLTIREIDNIDGTVTLIAEDRGPGDGCATSKDTSRPVHVISIEKSDYSSFNIETIQSKSAPCKIKLLDL